MYEQIIKFMEAWNTALFFPKAILITILGIAITLIIFGYLYEFITDNNR